MRWVVLNALLALSVLLTTGPLFARESAFPVHLSLGAEAVQDSNANRSSVEEDELGELQLSSYASLYGVYQEQENFSGRINYRWSRTDFQEGSEEDDSTLVGQANAVFGGANDLYSLNVLHEKSQLLIDPVAADSVANRESRETLSAAITFRTKPRKPNQLLFTVSQSNVSYDKIEFEVNDTESKTVELRYTRLITPLNTGGLSVSFTNVAYQNSLVGEYDNTLVYAYFQRQLRELDYYLAFGINKTSTAVSDSHNPYAQLNVGYSSGRNQFTLSAGRQVTDSSRGEFAGIRGLTQEPPEVVDVPDDQDLEASADGSLSSRDQIDRTSLSLNYSTGVLCERCSAGLSLALEEDEYFNSPEENSKDFSAVLRLGYQATRQATINLSLRQLAFEYTDRAAPNNYTQNSAQIGWAWQSTVSGLRLGAFVSALERNFDREGSYSGMEYGASLSYTLF